MQVFDEEYNQHMFVSRHFTLNEICSKIILGELIREIVINLLVPPIDNF